MESPVPIFRFGPYESRPRTRELYKHGSKLKVRPRPLQLLNLLLSRAGDVVTREELRQELWSAETFVDFEHSLNTSIKEMRAVLSDSAADPRYIQTLPRLGYRFIAPVEIVELTNGQNSLEAHGDKSASPRPNPALLVPEFVAPTAALDVPAAAARMRPLRNWALPGLAAILIVIAVVYFQWSRSRIRPQPPSERIMLAVLPFQNLTGDPGQEYFSDGLTEEMIAQLGRLDPDHLGVIARTSVMHYKNTQEPVHQIGEELEVQYVLEGSVRRDSDKVRITAQLIQVKDQTHLWSRQYDRELSHLLTLQGEIAQEISDAIQVALGAHKVGDAAPPPAPIAPKSYEAYDLYLQGRYFWNKRTAQGLQQAVYYFQQAIAKDPGYARAYAGLADSYALMSAYNVSPPCEIIPQARTAALKALELDEKLAEAHASLALVAQNYDWDWQTAEKEYRRAIELDPNYATGHHWYAEHLALRGRFDEAFVEIERARQLDPLSLIIQADNGAILFFSRQYDRSIEQFRAVLELEPKFPRAHMIDFAYVQDGRFADALADIEAWRRVEDASYSHWTWATQAYVYGRAGQPVQAHRALEKLESISRRQRIDLFAFVVASVGIGDKDQAFAWLEKSVADHSPGLTAIKVDPIYDPLRSDPRFQELVRRVGLAQ